MAAQTTENDEEIIDLTELIEKGEAPANDAAASADKAEEGIGVQMQGLNDLPQQADEEIDALLAQMEAKDGPAPADAEAAAQPRKLNPNEELDMPGMGEVDKLLSSLDIPPQPRERAADAPARNASADSAAPADMDSVVDDLLNSINGPSSVQSAQPAQGPDVQDLLAAASGPATGDQTLSGELGALLQESAPAGEQAKTAPPQSPKPDLAADLDDLLATTAAPAPQAGTAAAASSETPDLAADLDSLLASITPGQDAAPETTPPAPAADASAEPAAASSAPAAAPETTKPAAEGPDEPLAQGADESVTDLDALLASITPGQDATPETTPPAPAADASAKPAAASPVPAAAPETAQPAAEAPAEPLAQGADESVTDLDALLASITPGQDATLETTPPAPAADASAEPAAASPAPAVASETAQPAAEALDAPLAQDADESVTDLDALPASITPGQDADGPGEDLDALLASIAPERELSASLDETPLTPQLEEAAAPEVMPEQDAEEKGGQADGAQTGEQLFASKAAAEPVADIPAAETEQREESKTETGLPEQTDEPVPAPPASSDEEPDFTAELDDLLITPMSEEAPAQAAHAGTHPDIADLNERLEHYETELTEAKARIAALEKASGTASASLEDLLRDGSPLHDRFAGLIASSVRQALQAMPTGVTEQALDERLQAVSLSNKSISARMDALETRLDNLEPRFNEQVEKAAAGAAARILREEIAKLVQG